MVVVQGEVAHSAVLQYLASWSLRRVDPFSDRQHHHMEETLSQAKDPSSATVTQDTESKFFQKPQQTPHRLIS